MKWFRSSHLCFVLALLSMLLPAVASADEIFLFGAWKSEPRGPREVGALTDYLARTLPTGLPTHAVSIAPLPRIVARRGFKDALQKGLRQQGGEIGVGVWMTSRIIRMLAVAADGTVLLSRQGRTPGRRARRAWIRAGVQRLAEEIEASHPPPRVAKGPRRFRLREVAPTPAAADEGPWPPNESPVVATVAKGPVEPVGESIAETVTATGAAEAASGVITTHAGYGLASCRSKIVDAAERSLVVDLRAMDLGEAGISYNRGSLRLHANVSRAAARFDHGNNLLAPRTVPVIYYRSEAVFGYAFSWDAGEFGPVLGLSYTHLIVTPTRPVLLLTKRRDLALQAGAEVAFYLGAARLRLLAAITPLSVLWVAGSPTRDASHGLGAKSSFDLEWRAADLFPRFGGPMIGIGASVAVSGMRDPSGGPRRGVSDAAPLVAPRERWLDKRATVRIGWSL